MPKGKPTLILAHGRRLCGVCRRPIDGKGRDHTVCRAEPGGSDFGQPETGQVPLKTTRGFSSEWNTPLERYLFGQSEEQRMLRALSERSIRQHEVFIAHLNDGEKLKDIAHRLGLSAGAVRYHFHEARKFAREWIEKQQKEIDSEVAPPPNPGSVVT